jgi:anthranilate phosphoribosyltransferase
MDIRNAIRLLVEGTSLSHAEMHEVMHAIMGGEATPAQIGGFLVALRVKGETVDEVVAAAEVIRSVATRVEIPAHRLVDTCGTGGDGAQTFNISTAAAFVAAAAGVRIAKHGSRSVSSRSGSADLLEVAGVRLDLDVDDVRDAVESIGLGFLFAQRHHAAMQHAAGPRREIGIRTLFNLLGPLTNPAGARCQVLGVFSPAWVEPMAKVLARLGSEHALVVHAEDGLDEISIAAPTRIAELKDGSITLSTITPESLGVTRQSLESLSVESAEESLKVIQEVFAGKPGPARDIVAVNAGAAIYVAGLSETLGAGVAVAQSVLDSGAAAMKLEDLIRFTQYRSKGHCAP